MNLIEESRSVLEAAGYRTALAPSPPNAIYFEDDSILGAVFVHSTLPLLLEQWEECQDRFLGGNSRVLRGDPVKAWNIYTVHLTGDIGSPSQVTEAFSIEEDFRGTRKLVRAGVVKRADVKEALLPLLPLQHRLTLSSKNTAERLRERLALLSNVLVRLTTSADLSSIELDLLEEP